MPHFENVIVINVGHGRPVPSVTTDDRAQRKPIVADRWSGLKPLRVAVRSMMILLFQEPPRTPLYRPLVGPGGFLPGM